MLDFFKMLYFCKIKVFKWYKQLYEINADMKVGRVQPIVFLNASDTVIIFGITQILQMQCMLQIANNSNQWLNNQDIKVYGSRKG